MTPTTRQREEWERKRKIALDKLEQDMDDLSDRLDILVKERDRLEEMTFEDSYFQFLSERSDGDDNTR